jgi:unsaturated rhamnogalacturonyl hydrolase
MEARVGRQLPAAVLMPPPLTRREWIVAAAALGLAPAARASPPPPVRGFVLMDATRGRLARFGPQVPVFLAGYFAGRQASATSWNYEDGVVWKGALDLYAATGDRAFLDYVLGDMAARVLPDGSIPTYHPGDFSLDNVNAGKIFFPLYALTGETRFRRAIDLQFAQLRHHPRTRSGNYWHKQVYPDQVWLDGLFMAQPFQAAYARLTRDDALFADTVRQFLTVERVMKRPDGLYVHGWDESRRALWADPATGRSACVWGRAMGWWACALVDTYEASNGLDPAGRAEIARLARDTLAAVIRVRSPRGLWYQVMDQAGRAGNYEEASASLMFGYGLMKAARLGVAGSQEGAVGRDSLHAAIDAFLTGDTLSGTCGVAGLGGKPYRDGSYAYYVSEKTRPNDPKGVGALAWALSEALRATGQ